jgi:ubiquinone/menaquinone biosynthesis C-methylase UbiE
MVGGYDDGYEACPCFWGRDPSSLVLDLCSRLPSLSGLRVLDAGCGEGKNAIFFADRGASVLAVDISEAALRNARNTSPDCTGINWLLADVCELSLQAGYYDIVIAYGLLHCLPTHSDIAAAVRRLRVATRPGGHLVLCSFNDRDQRILNAHPGFSPTFLPHTEYMAFFADWRVLSQSDADLPETHPNNGIPHSHSMTRLLVQRPETHDCV